MFFSNYSILTILLLMIGFAVTAQDAEVSLSFSSTQIEASVTGSTQAYVRVSNISVSDIEGTLAVTGNREDFYISLDKGREIFLKSMDSVFIPLIIKALPNAKAGGIHYATATFRPKKGNVASATLIMHVRQINQLRALPEGGQLYYQPEDGIVYVPMHIYNDGNAAQNLTLAGYCSDCPFKVSTSIQEVAIPAFTDTVVSHGVKIDKSFIKSDNLTITLTTIYKDGTLISRHVVRANAVKNKHRYTWVQPFDVDAEAQQNQVSASTQYSRGVFSYYLSGNTKIKGLGGVLEAATDMSIWNDHDFFLRNAKIGYRNKEYGGTLGSVSRFSELSLIGRGADFFYNTDAKNKIEAGLLDKSFSLSDPIKSSSGKSLWLSLFHNTGSSCLGGYDVEALYDYDSRLGARKYIVSGALSICRKDYLNLRGAMAVSGQSPGYDMNFFKGGSLELEGSGKAGRFSYTSATYYSSPYFSGIRSGVINTNQRITMSGDNFNLWYAFSYLSVLSKSIYGFEDGSSFFTVRHDAGCSAVFGWLTVALAPYLYREKRSVLLGNGVVGSYSLSAARVNLQLNYQNLQAEQNFRLSLEAGRFSSTSFDMPRFHYRLNGTGNWSILSLYISYQYNNFYVGEAINAGVLNSSDTYSQFTILPAISYKFFNNRLQLSGGAAYNNISNALKTLQLSLRTEYSLTDDFSVFAAKQYSESGGDYQALTTFQLGLVKRFKTIETARSYKLTVQLLFNGSNNIPATAAAGEIVIIGDNVFRTDGNGTIVYKSLPPGNYTIQVLGGNGWYAPKRTLFIDSDTKETIFLNSMSTIRGKLKYLLSENSYEISHKNNGITVHAIGKDGELYSTKTDESGNFRLFVPAGDYLLTPEGKDLSKYVDYKGVMLHLGDTQVMEANILLKIRERQIETKKFSAIGFSAKK
ncbi:carboxypeptidase-like regulatory domain-containing protein [Flavobacterium sp. AG291]|uniref:COG1470 family protein n=1 Tax=Flavobacterium sp. AG291 TaxID=2184000 RepID=UPI000E2DF119|nr:carboxypeptidase-like regulatory domain-containing protein [Flavobacterium sp. AG291]RDI11212.1 hypothetical protein DEU42_106146 [Flavobacterium sp. AG291]